MVLPPKWQRWLARITESLIVVTVLVAAVALWRWYQDGGGFEAIYVAIGVAFAGLLAARRWINQEQETAVAPISPSPTWETHSAAAVDLTPLRRQMEQAYNLDDLRLLAPALGIHYDNLAGETLERKILSLLETCQKQNRLPDLLRQLQASRPRVAWAQPVMPVTAGLQSPRNRENLLNHLQTTWIDGFLKQSIHSEVLKLSLNYRSEAVSQRSWQLVLKQVGQTDIPVPPDRSLPEIFSASGRNLLILGEPGSGKTITMLQLAESFIATARQNPAEPLPLILNLSSWAREQKSLAEWLAEETFVQYGVARDLTRAGVAQNQFLYLLDGLDEVAGEAREACIVAINEFKAAHPAEMVVCSRVAEYEALQNRLHLGAAIQIQPLTDTQIDAYLSQDGLELQAVRATLAHDPDLKELAQTPLMLSLMTLAYKGLSREALRPLADKEARRRHLLDHYVQRMSERRPLPDNSPYTQEQAIGWLANLARMMVQHEQSVFYIEKLQPAWLGENGRWRRAYQPLVGLIGGLIGGLIVGLIGGLDSKIEIREVLNWKWVGIRRFAPAFGQGFILGAMYGLIGGIVGEFGFGFGGALLTGILLGLVGGGLNEYILKRDVGLIVGLIGGLIVGLIVGLIFGLIFECFEQTETETRLFPNQSIRQSVVNAISFVILGLSGGLIYGLVLWQLDGCLGELCLSLYFRFGGGLWGGLLAGVLMGISIFIGVSLVYGLETVIKHYTLRWLLARAGTLPYPVRDRRLVAFLDAMRDRILLRRVGGGWIFVHRSLLEYFANLLKTTK